MFFFFTLFVAGCAVLITITLIRPQLVYQYPYFMAATFTVFILPQAYALYRNGWGGFYLEPTLLMSFLCLAACWVGYIPRAHPGFIRKLNGPVNTDRFLHGGILMVLVGWYFTYKFGTLPEEELSSMLTGIGTIYLFFGGLVYPGFAICFYCALKNRGAFARIISALAAWVPIQAAVFHGRREPTALFILSLGMSLFFIRGIRPPRWLVAALILGTMFIIPATGEYRKTAAEDPLTALKQIDFIEQFNDYFEPDAISELKNATVLIAATQESGDYGFGTEYWNRIVFRFVPAQFVGKKFKNSLMIGGEERDWDEIVARSASFDLPTGSTVTGLGDSFNQFGYLGCLVFAAIGYVFKNLWAAANEPDGTVAQILYIQVTTSAMRALTNQSIDFLPGLIYGAIFIGLVALYAKERIAWPNITTHSEFAQVSTRRS